MSHKEEAVRVINLPMGGDTVMEAEVYALTHAVLALVEAQEAANEQARIANLIALACISDHPVFEDEIYHLRGSALWEGLIDTENVPPTVHGDTPSQRMIIRPEVTAVLGIGDTE